jgi:MFS transporter, PAT family, beta-lactamase induction signal transducer AmpG
VDLRRQLAVVALVYVIEGFPMGVYQHVLSVYFRRHGVSLTEIGLLSALGFAWTAKPLWSPLVERFGARQDWIRGALLAMATSLAAVAALPASPIGPALVAALATYCIASATQDIAIDGYTIGLVDRGREGPANAVRTTAYRVGLAVSGSGLLLLPSWIGWSAAFLVAAGLTIAFALTLSLTPPIALPPPSERRPVHSLLAWLLRPGVAPVLAFVVLFRIGDRAMGPMLPTFWVDRGFSDADLALFANLVGAVATIIGAVAGGMWVSRAGIVSALWSTGALALVSNLVYAAAAAWPDTGRIGVYVASLLEAVSSGAVGAAFVSYLMRICERQHAAVQYAVLTGLYASVGTLLASGSGRIAEATGYASYFALTAAFAAPAFAFLPRAARWIQPAADRPD